MKILHILEDFSKNSGGLRTVVKDLNEQLIKNGFNSYILSSNSEKGDDIYHVNTKNMLWYYSEEWKIKIKKICQNKKINIIHIHGVWMYPQYIASKYAIKNELPFLISTHGMYEPWLWIKGRLKKKLYFKFIAKPVFSPPEICATSLSKAVLISASV